MTCTWQPWPTVVLAAAIVGRLQTIVSRELSPGEFAVVTVGQIIAGTQSNIIVDRAVMELNLCTYSEETEAQVLAAIERIVRGECAAGGEEGTIPANHCPYSAPDPALTLQSGTEAIIVAARAWLG